MDGGKKRNFKGFKPTSATDHLVWAKRSNVGCWALNCLICKIGMMPFVSPTPAFLGTQPNFHFSLCALVDPTLTTKVGLWSNGQPLILQLQ